MFEIAFRRQRKKLSASAQLDEKDTEEQSVNLCLGDTRHFKINKTPAGESRHVKTYGQTIQEKRLTKKP